MNLELRMSDSAILTTRITLQPLNFKIFQSTNAIWKNYLKIAWRNILRSKGFSIINIGGLGIGIAASVLILIWIQFELSIDRFYAHSDRVYAVWRNATMNGEVMSWDYTPAPYGPAMKDKFPDSCTGSV